MKSIWMHAWNLYNTSPEAVVALLKRCGLDTCRLAFVYHGGRMLLPRNPRHTVFEHDRYSTFFPASAARYSSLPLRPHVAPEAALVPPFLEACQAGDIDVYAWTVLLHSERLASEAPECCVRNIFGDCYTYALCASHPDVRTYAVSICQDVAAQPGIAGIELEALGHMGYAHNSTHNKRGLPLPNWAVWLLSVCYCTHCQRHLGAAATTFEKKAKNRLAKYFGTLENRHPAVLEEALKEILGTDLLQTLTHHRQSVIRSLLDEIRAATAPLILDIRATNDPLAFGEKTPLAWDDLAERVDAITLTFFGSSFDAMEKELQELPPPEERILPLTGGIIFHYPDCLKEEDLRKRLALMSKANLDGYNLYNLGMATHMHLEWLAKALR